MIHCQLHITDYSGSNSFFFLSFLVILVHIFHFLLTIQHISVRLCHGSITLLVFFFLFSKDSLILLLTVVVFLSLQEIKYFYQFPFSAQCLYCHGETRFQHSIKQRCMYAAKECIHTNLCPIQICTLMSRSVLFFTFFVNKKKRRKRCTPGHTTAAWTKQKTRFSDASWEYIACTQWATHRLASTCVCWKVNQTGLISGFVTSL